jgi:uncharacterized coiled-coil DUF342 family protein
MDGAVWTLIGGIAASVVALITFRWQLPKIRAEARKFDAEASRTEWQTLRDEIDRLTAKVTAQDSRIDELGKAAEARAERTSELEKENRTLRTEVGRLRNRIAKLEAVFKIGPISPEMQAAIDRLKDVE